MGFPKPSDGCPDSELETGWLRADRDGRLLIKPFRTLANNAEGEAYAQRRGLEFPFSNDYHDAAAGPRHALALQSTTICTGVILIGYREPLNDHPVDCAEFAEASHRVPVAVWQEGASIAQVSELYRP